MQYRSILVHSTIDRSIQFRDACPEHKRKDLDALVKSLKGDEGAIQAAIVEWWNEPQQVEPEWEVKEKKPKKPAPAPSSSSGGGGGGGRRGSSERDGGRGDRRDRRDDRRGGGGGGRGGGRGGDRDRGGRGGGGGDRRRDGAAGGRGGAPRPAPAAAAPVAPAAPAPVVPKQPQNGGPAPVTSAPRPTGAWGKPAPPPAPMAPGAAAAKAAAPAAPAAEPKAAAAPAQRAAPEAEKKPSVGVVTDHDPTPSGTTPSKAAAAPQAATGGNVWATKGSAAIINAAKPKPKPTPVRKSRASQRAVEESKEGMPPVPRSPVVPSADASAAQQMGLPASVAGANINAAGWTPSADPADAASVASAKIPPSPKLPPNGAPPRAPAAQQKPASVLNLGQWDTNEGDENQSIDFAFGSFGQGEGGDDEAAAGKASGPAATEALPSKITKGEAPTAGVSPTRPPPGLGGMMPPMPTEGVVNVQDLEAKLDSSSLGPKAEAVPAPAAPKAEAQGAPAQAQQQIPQGYGAPAYGNMGMYGANGMAFTGAPLGQQPQAAPSSGGAPGIAANAAGIYGAPAAAGGAPADNKDQQQGGQPGGVPPAPGMQQQQQMGGMYGMPPMWNQNPYGQPHVGQGYGYGGYQQNMYGQQFQAPAGFGGYGQPYQQQADGQQHNQGGGHNNQGGGRGGYRGNRGRNNNHGGGYHNQNQYNQHGYGGGYQQPNMCKF